MSLDFVFINSRIGQCNFNAKLVPDENAVKFLHFAKSMGTMNPSKFVQISSLELELCDHSNDISIPYCA